MMFEIGRSREDFSGVQGLIESPDTFCTGFGLSLHFHESHLHLLARENAPFGPEALHVATE